MRKIFFLSLICINIINANQFQCEMASSQLQWNENALSAEIESGVGDKYMIDTYAKEALKNAILMQKSCDSLSNDQDIYLKKRIIQIKTYLGVIPNNKIERTPKVIYKTCMACHGKYAEKKALGSSQIIAGWKIEKIKSALHGYKNGTYGGAMKGVMKGQAVSMSDTDIDAVAKYINSL